MQAYVLTGFIGKVYQRAMFKSARAAMAYAESHYDYVQNIQRGEIIFDADGRMHFTAEVAEVVFPL